MIEKITSSIPNPCDRPNTDFVFPNELRFSNSIESSLKTGDESKGNRIWTLITELFQSIWSWIKTTLLFCFFDDDTTSQSRIDQLQEFVDFYFDCVTNPSEINEELVTRKFRNLDQKLREEIEAAIKKILKDAKSTLTEDKLKKKCKSFIEHPFQKIIDPNRKEGEQEVQVVWQAIVNIQLGSD